MGWEAGAHRGRDDCGLNINLFIFEVGMIIWRDCFQLSLPWLIVENPEGSIVIAKYKSSKMNKQKYFYWYFCSSLYQRIDI